MKRFAIFLLLIFFVLSHLASCSAPDDTSRPTITLVVPVNGGIYQPDFVIRGVASDNDLKAVYVLIDNGNWQRALGTSTWAFFPQSLTSGVHQVQAYAIDGSGNKSEVVSAKFYVDRDYPDFQIVAPYNGEKVNSHDVQVRLSATDDVGVAKAYLSLDGGEFVAVDFTQNPLEYTFTGVPNGEHVVRAYVIDKSGKKSNQISVQFSVTVDHTPPVVVIGTPEDGRWYHGGDVFIAGRATDDYSGVKAVYISLDGGNTWEMVTGTSSWMEYYPELPDGKYDVLVKAVDNMGNESTAATVSFYYDARPSRVIFSSIENGATIGYPEVVTYHAILYDPVSLGRMTFTFTNGNGDTYSTAISYPAFTTVAEFSIPITLAAGENYISIHTVDYSGNEDDYLVNFYVDWFPPVVEITSQRQTPPSDVEISGVISDYSPVTWAVYRIDDESWTSFGSIDSNIYNFTISRSNIGSSGHTLYVRARDQWGNEADFSYEFFYDITGPVVTIQYPPHDGYYFGLKPITVKGIATDSGSGVAAVFYCVDYPCYVTPGVNGATVQGDWLQAQGNDMWEFTVAGLNRGRHLIHVVATDIAGNYGYASTVSVMIAGDTIYLSSEYGDNYNSGVTATEPLKTFDYAYLYAMERGFSKILISEGNYDVCNTDETSFNVSKGFELLNGIDLYGGYSNDFTYNDPLTFATVVSNTCGGRIFLAEGITEPTVMSGLYVYGGDVTESAYPYGGGLLVRNSNYNFLITSCTFSHNKAMNGGGVALVDSPFNIVYSRFVSNEAGSSGGGVYFETGYYRSVTISNDLFYGNVVVEGDTPARGGAFYVSGLDRLFIEGSGFYYNRAGDGGAISAEDVGYLEVTSTTFAYNEVVPGFWSDGMGGALFIRDSSVTVRGTTTFMDNKADRGGGISFTGDESYRLDLTGYGSGDSGVQFLNNDASVGGGIYMNGGMGIWEHISFKENRSEFASNRYIQGGGAFALRGTKLEIRNVTTYHNYAENMCGVGDIYQSKVKVSDGDFVYDTANRYGAVFCVNEEDAALYIESSAIDDSIAARDGGAVLIYDGGRVYVDSSSFTGNRNGVFNILGRSPETPSRLKLVRSTFVDNQGFYGAVFHQEDYTYVEAYDNEFSRNLAYYGGVWYLYARYGVGNVSVYSHDNRFEGNVASGYGGVVYVRNPLATPFFDLRFYKDTFRTNSASYGGVFSVYRMIDGDKLLVSDSQFSDNRSGSGGAAFAIFYASQSDIMILKNLLTENIGKYIYIFDTSDASGIKIINNVLSDSSKGYTLLSLESISGYSGNLADPVVVNNVFEGGDIGVAIGSRDYDRSKGYYVNNIFAYNGEYGIYESNPEALPNVLLNNDFYLAGSCLYRDSVSGGIWYCRNSATDINNGVDTDISGENKDNVDYDPGFTVDWHIAPDSQLIDAGYDPVNDPDNVGLGLDESWTDFDGQLRPYDDPNVPNIDSAWDIGVDEYEP